MAHWSDRAAFERLVEECLPCALRFALRLTGDPDSAEEVIQDAMLKACHGWKSFRGDAAFQTWLFRIVIHCFREHLARHPPPGALPGDVIDGRGTEPASEAATRELGQIIARYVSDLPPRQREVLILASYEGFPPQQIARLLDTTEGNVHATLHVARRRLRSQLAPYLSKK